jgi:hypothetical protein
MTSSIQPPAGKVGLPKPAPKDAPKAPAKPQPAATPAVIKPIPASVPVTPTPKPEKKASIKPKTPAIPVKGAKAISITQQTSKSVADFGFLGSMNLKEALQHIGAQIGYAFAITIGILIGIEWLMPGSVLPFINIISLLPFSFVAVVFLIAFKGRQQGFLNTLNIIVGIIITISLLASMLTNMPIYGLRTILLATSVSLIIAVWAIAMYTDR